MNCECGGESTVIDSRPHHGGIRRRRKCVKCGERWSTLEKRGRFMGHLDNVKKMNRMRRVKAQERKRAKEEQAQATASRVPPAAEG